MATENTGHLAAKKRGNWPSAKHALAETIHRSSVSVDEISIALGRAYSSVQKWGDVHAPDNYPPTALLPLLVKIADNPAFLDYLESCAGRVAFTVPNGSKATIKQLGDLCMQFGVLLAKVGEAEADDVVTLAEFFGVKEQGHVVIAGIAGFLEAMRQGAVDPPNADREIRLAKGAAR